MKFNQSYLSKTLFAVEAYQKACVSAEELFSALNPEKSLKKADESDEMEASELMSVSSTEDESEDPQILLEEYYFHEQLFLEERIISNVNEETPMNGSVSFNEHGESKSRPAYFRLTRQGVELLQNLKTVGGLKGLEKQVGELLKHAPLSLLSELARLHAKQKLVAMSSTSEAPKRSFDSRPPSSDRPSFPRRDDAPRFSRDSRGGDSRGGDSRGGDRGGDRGAPRSFGGGSDFYGSRPPRRDDAPRFSRDSRGGDSRGGDSRGGDRGGDRGAPRRRDDAGGGGEKRW